MGHVDRLPPRQQCVETVEDERALAAYLQAIEQAQALDRDDVRRRAVEEFGTEHIVDEVILALTKV
jgi:hypothetical protein